jgi:hypothetical protein
MFSISCARTLPKTRITWPMPGDGLAPSALSESKWGSHWPPPLASPCHASTGVIAAVFVNPRRLRQTQIWVCVYPIVPQGDTGATNATIET